MENQPISFSPPLGKYITPDEYITQVERLTKQYRKGMMLRAEFFRQLAVIDLSVESFSHTSPSDYRFMVMFPETEG